MHKSFSTDMPSGTVRLEVTEDSIHISMPEDAVPEDEAPVWAVVAAVAGMMFSEHRSDPEVYAMLRDYGRKRGLQLPDSIMEAH